MRGRQVGVTLGLGPLSPQANAGMPVDNALSARASVLSLDPHGRVRIFKVVHVHVARVCGFCGYIMVYGN